MILKLIKSRSFCNPYVTTYTNAYFLELYLSKYGIFNQGKFETYRIKQVEKDSLGFLKEISPNHISGKQLGFLKEIQNYDFPMDIFET